MLSEKYAEVTRTSEMVYAKREARKEALKEGEVRGIINTLRLMNQPEEEIIKQLMIQMGLNEKEARKSLKQS